VVLCAVKALVSACVCVSPAWNWGGLIQRPSDASYHTESRSHGAVVLCAVRALVSACVCVSPAWNWGADPEPFRCELSHGAAELWSCGIVRGQGLGVSVPWYEPRGVLESPNAAPFRCELLHGAAELWHCAR
jgi:hypothetical protein